MLQEEQELLDSLVECGQGHLTEQWSNDGVSSSDKQRLARQLFQLDQAYPGGLLKYLSNARRLLADSREGKNAFHGYEPSVPIGEKLDYGSAACSKLEDIGLRAAGKAAFVLVAGGLGERLGYSGIKLALPADSARGASFLQLYIENILALETKAKCSKTGTGKPLPLVIMTSDDTHSHTQQLLEEHAYYGADPSQIRLLKQEKVPCLADGDARLALAKDDNFQVQTKPHGHGDVHSLLYSSGVASEWQEAGVEWLFFFQDTNGLVFRALPAALGVSASNGYDVNSLAVPRKAKEAIGALTQLTQKDTGHQMTINVEYNLLDPLLRATSSPDGDVNDSSGFSPFPGNINQLVIRLAPYMEQLHRSKGVITEFVNPKYADDSRTSFRSATRLECMMQDYMKDLPSEARVAFTVINQVWAAYSPVKNSVADAIAKVAAGVPAHSATTGELDIYAANCRLLRMVGASVGDPRPVHFSGQDVELWPQISWHPSFAQTANELRARLPVASDVHIKTSSSLVIDVSAVQIKAMHLDGALRIWGNPGAEVVLDGITVDNEGWQWVPLQKEEQATEEETMRGFKVRRTACRNIECPEARLYYVGSKEVSSKSSKLLPLIAAT